MNDDLSDIATALTGSLARNGEGGMTGALPLSVDGFFYTADPDTGMSRSAANEQVISCGGADWTFTATALTDPTGNSLGSLIGEVKMWMGSSAPTGYVLLYGQACTTSYPLTRAILIASGNPYGTSGGDPLFPDLRCVVPLGKGNMGGSDRGLMDGSTVLGALLGTQTITLARVNLPNYDLPSGFAVSDTRVWETAGNQLAANASFTYNTSASPGLFTGTKVVSVTSGSIGLTGATALGGSSAPIRVVQPSIVINFIARAA